MLGTPVVSTDCPSGPREILTGNLSRYLVPPGDIDGLARMIKSALQSPPSIPAEILERFDSRKVIESWIKTIKSRRAAAENN